MTQCYLCEKHIIPELLASCKRDKYQKSIGFNIKHRTFYECPFCELIFQENGMIQAELENIYLHYRDKSMRKTTISEKFDEVVRNPYSENKDRITWLFSNIDWEPKTILDIGSGLGVFPYELTKMWDSPLDIECIEPNPDSARFIRDKLGFECKETMFEGMDNMKDLVTVIHVLEHTKDPVEFLKGIKAKQLFIEVPDAKEFEYLPAKHDEFNSTHLWFFRVSTLDRMLRKANWEIQTITLVYYQDRKLARIRLLAV